MECLYPQARTVTRDGTNFVLGYRCGNCIPCGIERREGWAGRILLESQLHACSSFITLTYDDYHLPENESVDKEEITLWIRRLRYQLNTTLRFFAVGEYGEHYQRPHYHAVIFGLPWTAASEVQKSWSKGFTSTYDLSPGRARYVASYTVKKITDQGEIVNKETGELLKPEFMLSSRRPGIAHGAFSLMLEAALKAGFSFHSGNHQVVDVYGRVRKVPGYFRFQGHKYPMSRYLEEKLREQSDGRSIKATDRKDKRRCVLNHSKRWAILRDDSLRERKRRARSVASVRSDYIVRERKGRQL